MLKGLNYSQYLTKSRALLLCLSSLVFVSVFSSGCSNSTPSPGAGVDPNRIVVLGSDTMEELVRTWANGFMMGNPGIQVTVSSGDTGVGIKDLIEGKIDVASGQS
jgi:ABC-type phosphate transport system substrate-binding protein